MVRRDHLLQEASTSILLAEKDKNFSDLALILGQLLMPYPSRLPLLVQFLDSRYCVRYAICVSGVLSRQQALGLTRRIHYVQEAQCGAPSCPVYIHECNHVSRTHL